MSDEKNVPVNPDEEARLEGERRAAELRGEEGVAQKEAREDPDEDKDWDRPPGYKEDGYKAITGEGVGLLEQRLQALPSVQPKDDAVEFDPTIIIALLSAILPLITQCFQRVPQAARTPALLRRQSRQMGTAVRLSSAIKAKADEVGVSCNHRQAARMAQDVLSMTDKDKSKDDEIQLLINDCCA